MRGECKRSLLTTSALGSSIADSGTKISALLFVRVSMTGDDSSGIPTQLRDLLIAGPFMVCFKLIPLQFIYRNGLSQVYGQISEPIRKEYISVLAHVMSIMQLRRHIH